MSMNSLKRLAELQAHMLPEPTMDNDWAYEEYRALLKKVVPTYLGLVQALVRAGLLSIHFPDKGTAYQIESAFDNGNIWLVPEEDPFMLPADNRKNKGKDGNQRIHSP